MNNKLKLNYSEISIDPINSYYLKIRNNVDDIIDEYLLIQTKKHNKIIEIQKNKKNEIDGHVKNIENRKKDLKIKKLKIINFVIVFFCFLLIGLFFLPIYNKNSKIIKEYKKFEHNEKNEIYLLENEIMNYSYMYCSTICFEDVLHYVFEKFGITFSNTCNPTIEKHIKNNPSFLTFSSCLEFKYKASPIINVCSLHLVIEDVITSNSMTFPYVDYENCMDENGNMTTKEVTKYETLVAKHVEPTPFIKPKNKLYTLTNFCPSLDFSINNKKYLDFENNDFSKKFKINNIDKKINSNLLQFFTIKAQEDYLSFSEEIPDKIKWIDFKKFQNIISISLEDNIIPKQINNIYNIQNLIENRNPDLIDELNRKFKIIVSQYVKDFSEKSTFSLLSPVINREYYNNKNTYKIGNENILISDEKNISIDYVISKLNKSENLYFNFMTPKKESWLSILNSKKETQFWEINCLLNSYESTILIDYVQVVGMYVGLKTIPVEYEKFSKIEENKKIFFLKRKSKSIIGNFAISFTLKNTYNELHDNQEHDWKFYSKIWTPNPEIIFDGYDKSSKYYKFIQNIKQISSLIVDGIAVESFEEGYAIVINNEINFENENIIKIQKLILELNEL